MANRTLSIISGLVLASAASVASAAQSLPFDEETLQQIDSLNRAISEHYEELQTSSTDIEVRREAITERMGSIEEELTAIERERSQLPPRQRESGSPATRLIEEHRIEVKSRYLEVLAEKHATDLEAIRSFDVHGSAILENLEKLARALERSGRLERGGDDEGTRAAFRSLQQGTGIALAVLEDWGALTRDDPRFRALWATSRVLNRNLKRANAAEGIRLTVELVRERTFVVRSLIDQARALRSALDHQGLLLQVAAQNQMLRLHFARLGAISGLELPDLDIDDSTRRVLEDIEEEAFVGSSESGDPLDGFDDCVAWGVCE
jgi:hypothetical protein